MDPIIIPNDRKPILILHPRHKGGPASWRVKHAMGVGLVIALIGLIVFNLAAPGRQRQHGLSNRLVLC